MTPQAPAPSAVPEKRRRRPPLACEQCRQRKIRCDRNSPCGHCVRARFANCTYAPSHIPASKPKKSVVSMSSGSSPGERPQVSGGDPSSEAGLVSREQSAKTGGPLIAPKSSSPASHNGSASESSNVDRLLAKVRELEEKLANTLQISDREGVASATKSTAVVTPHTGAISKTRYFGSSHWLNVTDLLPTEYSLLTRAESDKGEMFHALAQCKTVARRIKKNRIRPISSEALGKAVPHRELADRLVETYLRTFEGVLRVLHVPTFRAEYERYWHNPEAANLAFVMQLQLCMALGAAVTDEIFALRADALHWVQEAQLWLMLPPEKSRMTMSGLQIMCLLVLAKSTCGVGHDLTWIPAGTLVRMAMTMGLHRDPKHLGTMSIFRAEMRRRLWATILELNLQCAFEAGGQPLLYQNDYDTELPANLDDEQLADDNDGEVAVGQPDEVPTQCSVQLALLKSLPLRVQLIRLVNDFRSTQPYEEILRINSELTKACRAVSHRLTSLQSKRNDAARKISYFHVSVAEVFMYRFFHALHQRAITKSFNDHRFYFSRRMCLDSALKLMSLWGLAGQRDAADETEERREFRYLTYNGCGLFRYVMVQSLFFIAVELIHERQGQTSRLGYLPSIGDSDLRACLEASKAWTLERIRAGETNGKGHCFVSASIAHVDALANDLDQEQVDNTIVRASTLAAGDWLRALEEVAQRELVPLEETEGEPTQMDGLAATQMEWMGDLAWDDMDGLAWEQLADDTFVGLGYGIPVQQAL